MTFKVGDRVKVSKNDTQSHGLPVGSVGTIRSVHGTGRSKYYYFLSEARPADGNYTMYERHLEPLARKKEDLLKEKEEILKQVQEVQDKIDFIEANGLEEYDETEFKCFQALTIASNTKAGKAAQAKALAKLIREGV